MTFDQALANFRNAVNRKFSPETSATKKTRRINQVKNKNKKGPKQGNHRGNQESEKRNQGNKRKNNDAWEVIGTDGSKIEVNPSYSFATEVWTKIPFPVRTQLMDKRKDYKRTRTQK